MTLQSNAPAWEQHLFALSQDTPCNTRGLLLWEAQKAQNRFDRQAIAACEAITTEYSRSFHLATRLLPRDKRRAMRVLYAFCRTADNLADGNVDHPAEKLLDLRRGIASQRNSPADAVLATWAVVRARYQIPVCYVEQLLDGIERDLVQRRYRNFKDLAIYCYGVASTVGLMSMHITGFADQRAIPFAIKLGVALQLTNILRDVGEDWNCGRFYLPLDELSAFDLDEQDVAAAKVDDRWVGFMRFQITRARQLYAEAMPGISLLHPDGRFAVAAAAMLYRGILDDIEDHDYDVFNRRSFVPRGRKLALLLRSFVYAKRKPL